MTWLEVGLYQTQKLAILDLGLEEVVAFLLDFSLVCVLVIVVR